MFITPLAVGRVFTHTLRVSKISWKEETPRQEHVHHNHIRLEHIQRQQSKGGKGRGILKKGSVCCEEENQSENKERIGCRTEGRIKWQKERMVFWDWEDAKNGGRAGDREQEMKRSPEEDINAKKQKREKTYIKWRGTTEKGREWGKNVTEGRNK